MTLKNLFYLIGVTGLVLFLSGVAYSTVEAQEPLQWAYQKRIPWHHDSSQPPVLVADRNDTVHAFNMQVLSEIDTQKAIFHRTWTLEDGWSEPTDVILGPARYHDPKILGAFLDQNDIVHVAYFIGNELSADLYYTRAPISLAGDARAWLPGQRLMAEVAGPFAFGEVIGDGRDFVMIVFESKRDGVGAYEVHSNDGGKTWSEIVPFHLVYSDELWPAAFDMDVDPQGLVHISFSVWNNRGRGAEILYTNYEPTTNVWLPPVTIAVQDPTDYEADWPSIKSYDGELILVYQDGNPATRWMRRSQDNGVTWSLPERPWPHVGEYRDAIMIEDSDNVLHLLTGNRTADCCHGMWHAVWQGDKWSDLVPVVMGPKSVHFDPSGPEAVIVQGNTLLVTWWTDTGHKYRNGAWYSYTQLDSPKLPLLAPFVPTATPTATPVVITSIGAEPTATPRRVVATNFDMAPPPPPGNPALPIFISSFAAMILAGLLIFVHNFFSQNR